MHDLLASWGLAAADLAVPLALWTAVALLAEASLRLGRAHAALSLPVRSALMAALPLSLLVGPLAQRIAAAGVAAPEALVRVRDVVLPEVVVGASAVPVEALGPPLWIVAFGVLLLVAVGIGGVALVRLGVARTRLARLGWPEAPAPVQALAAEALRAAGVRRPVRVVVGGEVPFTFGARRPTVAVPADLHGEALRLALAHEAAHVRAHDALGQAAASVVAAVFAAHPLVHVLLRGLSLDRERLADAAVLTARPAARRAYGDLLVSFSDGATPRLALGVAPGRSPLLHRLSAMKTPLSPSGLRRVRLWGRLAAGLALVFVTAVGALASGSPAAEAQTRPLTPRPNTPTLTVRGDTVLEFSQVQPELIGGIEGLQARIVYPEGAKRDSVEGRVIAQFVIDPEGRTEQIEIARRVDPRLDSAAVEAIRASTFIPGRQNGRAVAVRMTLPVTFRLRSAARPPDAGVTLRPDTLAVQYPNARVEISGLDLNAIPDRASVERTLAMMTRMLAFHGDLPDGTRATVYFSVDLEGQLMPQTLRVISAHDGFGQMSTFVASTLNLQHLEAFAGRRVSYTTTFVRGD